MIIEKQCSKLGGFFGVDLDIYNNFDAQDLEPFTRELKKKINCTVERG